METGKIVNTDKSFSVNADRRMIEVMWCRQSSMMTGSEIRIYKLYMEEETRSA
jgi:hypothetical protein